MANMWTRMLALVPKTKATKEVAKLKQDVESLTTKVRIMKAGVSGVPITFGHFDYESNTLLQGTSRWDLYDKMESDPHIKAGLDAVVLPLQTAKWEVQPASEDPKDVEIAEFVSANLLRTSGDTYGHEYWVQTSWTGQRLVEILDCLKSGYSMFQKSTKEVNGKIVYDRLQWLEPRSVDPHGWLLSETDELQEVQRTYRTPNLQYVLREPLKVNQLMMYIWDLRGARFEGRPRIRSAYGAFTRKDFIQRAAVIWAQKIGAPMPVAHYPEGFNPTNVQMVEKAVQAARGQSPAEAYALFPKSADDKKVEFEFIGSKEGQVDRMRGLINGENSEIAHAVGTKSGLLGETATGSRAVGETQSADEDVFTQAIAVLICDIENHGMGNIKGLVQELVDWNFPGVKKYPKLIVSRIGPWEDLTTLDPLLKAIAAGIVPKTVSVMKQVTEKFGITLPDEEYESALEEANLAKQHAQDVAMIGAANIGQSKPGDNKPGGNVGKQDPGKQDPIKKGSLEFNEEDHPRAPRGSSRGGKWVGEVSQNDWRVQRRAEGEEFRTKVKEILGDFDARSIKVSEGGVISVEHRNVFESIISKSEAVRVKYDVEQWGRIVGPASGYGAKSWHVEVMDPEDANRTIVTDFQADDVFGVKFGGARFNVQWGKHKSMSSLAATAKREMTPLEKRCLAVPQLRNDLETGADNVHQQLRVIRDKMIGELQSHMAQGKINRRNLDGMRRVKFRGTSKSMVALSETLKQIGSNGAAQLAAEIKRGKNAPR